MRRALCLVALVLVGCASDARERRAPPPPPADGVGRWYEVEKGDTLFALSRRFDVPVEELAEVNGLGDGSQLAVGQRLFIPTSTGGRAPVDVAVAPAPPPPEAAEPVSELSWPVDDGVLLRAWDPDGKLPHEGLLFAAPAGTEVHAAAGGEVVFVGDEGTLLGTLVIVKHPGELVTIYAHLAEVRVKKGARVARGQELGTVGESGRAESPQLHFQVRSGRTPVDPLSHLPPP